jgi:hypothetical protein
LMKTNTLYQEMVRLQTLETLVGETSHAWFCRTTRITPRP